jgi:hypothetical protein
VSADSQLALWLAVIAFGAYHGLNPAMGWPLAVANGLTRGRDAAVFATLAPLAAGHLLAMAVVLLPFTLLSELESHRGAVQLGAALLAVGFGAYKLLDRRHPRFLARIRPTQIAWWSFSMATAHGAALMLAPVALGLCAASPAGADGGGSQSPFDTLLRSTTATAVQVAVVHTAAMLVSAVAIAWLFYRFLGLQLLSRTWLNLDALWGLSLVVAGGASGVMAVWPHR